MGRDPYRRYPTESALAGRVMRRYQPFRSYPMQSDYMENPAMDPSLYRQSARQSYPYSYPQDSRPGYVPNRYFNRMRPGGQPNLLQMMEESDRQQARQMMLRQQLERYEPLPPDYRQHPEMGRMNYPNYAMRMPGMDRAAMGYCRRGRGMGRSGADELPRADGRRNGALRELSGESRGGRNVCENGQSAFGSWVWAADVLWSWEWTGAYVQPKVYVGDEGPVVWTVCLLEYMCG